MTLKRKCKRCKKDLFYANKSSYNNAVKENLTCRSCGMILSDKKKQSDISILLEDTPITYYWIGFLLADGNFGQGNIIKCALSSVDKDHLINLKNYLKIKSLSFEKSETMCCIKAMDTINAPLIRAKFNIHHQKTYNPPNLSFIKNDNLKTALIIGFIDGDGCISHKNKSFSITVQCHSAWLNNLMDFAKFINPSSTARINTSGYAYFSITNHLSLKKLKQKTIELKLPVLKRKWDKIDMNFVPNKEAHQRNFKTFEKLFNKFKGMDYFSNDFNKLVYGK